MDASASPGDQGDAVSDGDTGPWMSADAVDQLEQALDAGEASKFLLDHLQARFQ